MTHYFGFEPSSELNDMIDEATSIIESGVKTEYYPYRDAIAHKIGRELIDNTLVSLVEVIPNSERQKAMRKIVGTIENTTDKMLNVLMTKDDNEQVLPTFKLLKESMLFEDNQGIRHLGFQLEQDDAQAIFHGFNKVTPNSVDIKAFQKSLHLFNDLILEHFINRFAATLPLGIIKRNAVPVAEAGISKGLHIAINKLFPQLDNRGMNRLVNFYRPYIVEVSS